MRQEDCAVAENRGELQTENCCCPLPRDSLDSRTFFPAERCPHVLNTSPLEPNLLRQQILVLLAAACVFFLNLGGPGLWDDDEPKNAECAREMLERLDWVVPTFNAELRTDKPILLYWLMLCSYKVLGVSEFAARIWSALLSLGTVTMVYHLGRRLYRPEVGFWAGLAMASGLMFGVSSRAATPDATLIFCTTLALTLFAFAVKSRTVDLSARSSTTSATATLSRFVPTTARWAGVCAAMGFAVLAKGPAGVVLPVGVMAAFFVFLAAVDVAAEKPGRRPLLVPLFRLLGVCHPVRAWGIVRAMRPLLAMLIVGSIALPWYVLVGIQTKGAWLKGFLGVHNVDRFLSPMEGHSGPIFYYVIAILAGFFPWSLLLPAGIAQAVGRLRQRYTGHWEDLFVLCWAGVYVGFFSLARTKLPSYVLPCYPALALIAGRFVDGWLSRPESVARYLPRLAFATCSVMGVCYCGALPFVAQLILPGEQGIALAGVIPLVGGALAWHFTGQNAPQKAAVTFALMAVAFASTLFGIVALRVDRHQNSEAVVSLIRDHAAGGAQIATLDYFRPSLVFYARQTIPELQTVEEAGAFLRNSPAAYLITRNTEWEKLKPLVPADIAVLDSRRMFLRRHDDVILLGRPGQDAVGRMAQESTGSSRQ